MINDKNNLKGFSDESIKEFINNNVDNGKRNIIIVSGENNSGKTSFVKRLKNTLSNEEYEVYNIEAARESKNTLESGHHEKPFIPLKEKGIITFWIKQFQKVDKYLRGIPNTTGLSNLGAIKFIQNNTNRDKFLEKFSKIFLTVISGNTFGKLKKEKTPYEKLLNSVYGDSISKTKLYLIAWVFILILFFVLNLLYGKELSSGEGFLELIRNTPRIVKFIIELFIIMILFVGFKDFFFARNHYVTIEFENGENFLDKSEGTFHLLPNIQLIYVLKYNEVIKGRKTFCSISEPESHLHPAAQERLATEYYTAINEYKGKNLTLVFETHSVNMIKKFAEYSKNKASDINFVWLNLEKNKYDLNIMKRDFWKENKFNYPMGTGLLSDQDEKEIREQYELEIKAQKEIISYITHTVGNTLHIVPARVKTTVELMDRFSNDEKANPVFNMALSEIVSLNSTFAFLENMLRTFKVFIREKDKLLSDIINEDIKDVDAGYILSIALQSILNKVLFETGYYDYKVSITGNENSQIDKAFINEIIMLQNDSFYDSQKIITWIKKNFPYWEIDLSYGIYKFSRNGIKTNLVISILLELIDNAIKHSKKGEKITIKWLETDMGIDFLCSNVYDNTNKLESKGGSLFLSRIEAIFEKRIEIQTKKEQGINIVHMNIKREILNR